MKVGAYEFGRMTVDGKEYTNDLILFPDRVLPQWWRAEGHSLCEADLEEVFKAQPDRLVVGTGASDRMDVPRQTLDAIRERGIEVEVMQTRRAVKRWNELVDQQANVAGTFHLTC